MKKVLLLFELVFAAGLSYAQWEPDIRLTNDPGHSHPANNNSKVIAASGDTLHVVWYDDRDGNNEIYYKRSADGGISWGADTRLTNNAALSIDPCVLVSDTVVHVVWEDNRDGNREIYYKRSEDGGSTWGIDTRLTNAIRASESPCLAISGNDLHVVWYDERDDPNGNWYTEIYYKRSTDGGLTWGSDTRLTNKAAYAGFPCVAVSGSMVHVAWEDERNGNGDVYYKRSTDGGLTWEPDSRLTNDPADQYDPCLAVSDSVVHVVWQDNRNGYNNDEIYYKRSTDGGLTWGQDTRLTIAPDASDYATIAVSGPLVHIVWYDNRNINYEIYYKQSPDAGASWEADTRLTNTSGFSRNPFIALSGSNTHVVWTDDRDGNDEIYYKRNPTGNIPVGMENDRMNNAGKQISIWPNPASNTLHIDPGNYSSEQVILTIRNILGKELLFKQILKGEMVIDVSNFQNGLYFMGIATDEKQTVCTKLIILK